MANWQEIEKKCKIPIEYHGKLLLRPQICPLRTYGNSPLCPTGHRPFGAAAQWRKVWQTDQRTDGESVARDWKKKDHPEFLHFSTRCPWNSPVKTAVHRTYSCRFEKRCAADKAWETHCRWCSEVSLAHRWSGPCCLDYCRRCRWRKPVWKAAQTCGQTLKRVHFHNVTLASRYLSW